MKRIGIIFSRRDNVCTGINNAYLTYFEQFGEIVYINPLSDTVIQDLDLLVLPGGRDVDPARYGKKPHRQCGFPNLDMEYFDVNVLPLYIKDTNTPMVMICRGAQTGNVNFGGTLQQHIAQEFSGEDRSKKVDGLEFTTYGHQFAQNLGIGGRKKGEYKVNSIHHQGWWPEQVGEGFEVVATNYKYGNVEAMYHPDRKLWAVQYHPEEMFDVLTTCVIRKKLINE